ncbi:ribosome biogenesis protein BRX1 homolog isoform X2 [Stegodyphus dumicola]|uniref:ribosome biogenesis protein BRX1 homolog isoform X2 n=1 Tax=Stegodyphus dumicola TaxID=202533 RepID=UPI0015AB93A6|nr:ribosome biogenesis protein BRX1 homolog isoform X2 [Stegodyphus dumicola]
MGKRKREIPESKSEKNTENHETAVETSNDKPKRGKWINKQRVLIFASRGIAFRDRHLMNNLRTLLPHSKPESKMEKKGPLLVINEICEMKNCNHCIYFENKKHQDLYMWISNVPSGPSAKFLIENVHTMEELKLTGNCLKGSRPILSFDSIFGTPKNHPKSQPFFDHVYNFAILDNRIWFRNYQIEDDGASLVEIGPRFVMNLIKVFDGSFCGSVLYTNPHYITPSMHRRNLKLEASNRYKHKYDAKKLLAMRRPKESYKVDPYDDVFDTTSGKKEHKSHE